MGIGLLSRVWGKRGVKLTTYPSGAEFKIEWSYISTHRVCFHAWTGKEPAAMYSIFAHGTGQISNVSIASYCTVRNFCGVHCTVFLQMIPATFRNIWHWLSTLSLHRLLNMFFASCECSKYHAVEMPIFICFTYTGIRNLMMPLCSLPSFTAFYTRRCVRYTSWKCCAAFHCPCNVMFIPKLFANLIVNLDRRVQSRLMCL